MDSKVKLTQAQIEAIEEALNKRKRIEVIQTSDGVKVFSLSRTELKIVTRP